MQAELSLSSACVRALLGGVALCGHEPEQLLAEGYVDQLLLNDPRARISLHGWHRLVRRAIDLTGDDGLGLLIGGHVSEHALQIVGPLAVSCSTLREAVRMLSRYGVLLTNTVQFELIEEGELAYFVCNPLVPVPGAPQFDAEMALGLVYRVARRIAATYMHDAREVWMCHPAPAHVERYAAVFGCPVRFGRPKNAILAPRHVLDQRQAFADASMLELLKEGAERMLESIQAPSLPDRVRALLRYESDLSHVDATRIARILRLQPRALRRRLIQAHAPWSALLDEARCRVACDELRHGDTSIRELSERLGFSEQSAFNRAFKRWTGQTPGQYSRSRPAISDAEQRTS